MGKFAKGTPPKGTPEKFDFNGMKIVMPYLIKGMLLGKAKGSPFFLNGEPIAAANVLSSDERKAAHRLAGFE